MYFIPFVVGIGFQRFRGQTWLSSSLSSGVVVWTSAQIRKGAILRLMTAANTLMSMTLWNVAAGIGLGIAGGIGVSTLLFGKEGKEAAIDLYTGKVSAGKYVDTVVKGISSIPERIEYNRAVPGNAAGIAAGTNMAQTYTPGQGMQPDYSHPNWQSGWWNEETHI